MFYLLFPIVLVWPRCSDFQSELWLSRLSRNNTITMDQCTALFIQYAEQIIYQGVLYVAL